MPPAVGAHLDEVRGEIVGALVEHCQLPLRRDAPAMSGQPGPEDIGEQHELAFFADRAGDLGVLAHILGRPDEFGVGIAHLVANEAGPGGTR